MPCASVSSSGFSGAHWRRNAWVRGSGNWAATVSSKCNLDCCRRATASPFWPCAPEHCRDGGPTSLRLGSVCLFVSFFLTDCLPWTQQSNVYTMVYTVQQQVELNAPANCPVPCSSGTSGKFASQEDEELFWGPVHRQHHMAARPHWQPLGCKLQQRDRHIRQQAKIFRRRCEVSMNEMNQTDTAAAATICTKCDLREKTSF